MVAISKPLKGKDKVKKKVAKLKRKRIAAKVLKKKGKGSAGPRTGYGLAAKPYGKMLEAKGWGMKKEAASSAAGNIRQGGLMTGTANQRIRPRIEFWRRQQFYLTVGRVQNVTESYVLNLQNREWYYDSAVEKDPEIEKAVKLMEAWEEEIVVTKFLGDTVRSWIVNGLIIVSPIDWLPLQLQSLDSKSRDRSGNTTKYFQKIDGVEKPIDAKEFIEVPYIEFDREPWPIGMFDSLMNADYLDVDGKDPLASLELYRQSLQDNMKIHHKFASPRVIYTADGVAKEVLDNDVVPVLEGMGPGDRAAFNVELKIQQETVDGNARFIEHVNKIIDEIDTGLQSSANRLITEPSAMADAREAGNQDDDRVLGIMERWRVFMNREVIPRVTGRKPGEVIFKWGAKDAFDLEFPEPLKLALEASVINPQQAFVMLEEQWHWKIPSFDEVKEKFGDAAIDPTKLMEPEEPDDEKPGEKKEEPPKTESHQAVNYESKEVQAAKIENIKADTAVKNNKIVFIDKLIKQATES